LRWRSATRPSRRAARRWTAVAGSAITSTCAKQQ
jgi:hypothetical protein